MARTNKRFPGIDFDQYGNWPQVVAPNGHVYYVPPGGQGYLYDPFSAMVFQDSRPAAQKQTDAEKQQQDAVDAQKAANSPTRQMMNIGGIAAVTAGVPIIATHLGGAAAPHAVGMVPASQGGGVLMSDGTVLNGANTAAQAGTTAAQGATAGSAPVATTGAATTTSGAGTVGSSSAGTWGDAPAASSVDTSFMGGSAPVQIGQNIDGTPIFAQGGDAAATTAATDATAAAPGAFSMSNLSAAPGTLGQVAGAAGGAYGTYNAINDWQHGGSGRTGLTEAGAGFGSMFAGPLGGAVGAIGGNILGYGLQGHGWKNDAALAAISPMFLGARLMGFDPVHKTTHQAQEEHTSDLQSQDPQNQAWQNYVNQARTGYGQAPPDPKNPYFGGRYATFDDYKKAGLNAGDLSSVYGNLDTYGPDWANLTEVQRQAITQKNIDSGLYDSKKGEVVINDKDKAKANYDAVISGTAATPVVSPAVSSAFAGTPTPVGTPVGVPRTVAPVVAAPTPVVTPTPMVTTPTQVPTVVAPTPVAPVAPVRTLTRSPGIGLNGQRISY